MNLALVHDWLNQRGGAEDVLEAMVGMYPGAPIYTSIYARELMPAAYGTWDIRASWMDRLPGIHRHHQPYLPLYAATFGAMRLDGCDVVLSNKSGFCHWVNVGEALHICYCLAPTRYVWQFEQYVQRERIPMAGVLRPLMSILKRGDFAAAQRVDAFIAISSDIRERIARFYQRESVIIYPPVEIERFEPARRAADYYLIVSRLVPYKRIDLAVAACSQLELPLIVAGSGRDRERLEAIAGPSVQFVGRVPDEDLPDLMARCKAFIFPGLEDFGITPLQAQAAGRPVIAFRGGGSLDTVIEGKTGVFFDEQTVESLVGALARLDGIAFEARACRENAARFGADVFRRNLAGFIEKRYDEHRMKVPRGETV